MVLQLVMDMAGTFPILGYLLIKKIFKKHMTAQKYIWILRLSIILYLCPFQEFKYLILLLLWNLFFYKKADKEEWNKDRLLFWKKGKRY